MTRRPRMPSDVATWREVVREASALENIRAHEPLIREIRFGPEAVEFRLCSGGTFVVTADADRRLIAAAATQTLGTPVAFNPALEWAPPEQTENYWWAETLYNFGMLAAEAIVMKPDVVFTRIWRERSSAKIEAYDTSQTVTATFDLRAPHPPVDTVTDVLEAFHRSSSP